MHTPNRRLDTVSANTSMLLNGLKNQGVVAKQEVSTDAPQNPNFIKFANAIDSGRFTDQGMDIYKEANTDTSVGRVWKKESFKNPTTGQLEDWLVVYTTDDDEAIKHVADLHLSTVAANPKPEDVPLAQGIKSKNITMDESGGGGTAKVTIDFTDPAEGLSFYQNDIPDGGKPASAEVAETPEEKPAEDLNAVPGPAPGNTPPMPAATSSSLKTQSWDVSDTGDSELHQDLMDQAYDMWKDHSISRAEFLGKLDEQKKAAVILGNLNYQVTNGGFMQWHDNGYSDNGEEAITLLDLMGTELASKGSDIVAGALSAIQQAGNHDNSYNDYENDGDSELRYNELADAVDPFDDRWYEINDELMNEINTFLHTHGKESAPELPVTESSIKTISSQGRLGVRVTKAVTASGAVEFSYVTDDLKRVALQWPSELKVGEVIQLPHSGEVANLLGYEVQTFGSDNSLVDHLTKQAVDISDEVPPMGWSNNTGPSGAGQPLPPQPGLQEPGAEVPIAPEQPAAPEAPQNAAGSDVLYDSSKAKTPKFQTTIDPNDNSVSVKFLGDDEMEALEEALDQPAQLPDNVAPAQPGAVAPPQQPQPTVQPGGDFQEQEVPVDY